MPIRLHSALPADLAQQGCAGRQAKTHPSGSNTEQAELAQGLLQKQAYVSPKFLYDTLGSKLFECLCLLPEYYPTRYEAQLIQTYLPQLAQAIGKSATLIDLGAGNCAKAESLFSTLNPAHYVAVDISADFLHEALEGLRARHPAIHMTALGQDFSTGLALPEEIPGRKRMFFYPGSSLGNFAPPQAIRFLQSLRQAGGADASLLLGVDLVKPAAVLNAAYDDDLGLTAAFNLNLLRNINHILKTDFDVRHWRHIAYFNCSESRIEMHLEARQNLNVCWKDNYRHFAAGERIHTENSYKYTRASLTHLLQQSGWQISSFWTDPQNWFALVHARAATTQPREDIEQ